MPETTRQPITVTERGFPIDSSTEHYELLNKIAAKVIDEMCDIEMTPTVRRSGAIQILFCMTNAEWEHLENPYKDTEEAQTALNSVINTQLSERPATRVVYTHCEYDASSPGCTFYFRVKS